VKHGYGDVNTGSGVTSFLAARLQSMFDTLGCAIAQAT